MPGASTRYLLILPLRCLDMGEGSEMDRTS